MTPSHRFANDRRLLLQHRLRLSASTILLCAAMLTTAHGQEHTDLPEGGSADPRSHQALQHLDGSWYDAESGRLQPVDVRPSDKDAANRDSRWNERRGLTQGRRSTGGGWINPLSGLFGGSRAAAWIMLVALIVMLFAVIFYATAKMETFAAFSRPPTRQREAEGIEDEAKLARLPVEVKKPVGNLLDEARRLMEQGRYDAAIVYLFSHMLIQLDGANLIRLSRGKTNRQYLRELRGDTTVREILQTTVGAFEASFFGHHSLSRDQFMRCWSGLEAFQRRISDAG